MIASYANGADGSEFGQFWQDPVTQFGFHVIGLVEITLLEKHIDVVTSSRKDTGSKQTFFVDLILLIAFASFLPFA